MTPTEPNVSAPAVRPQGWWMPWVVLTVVGVYLLSVFGRMAPPKEPTNLDAFARVPVVDTGRVKPLDTVARVSLRVISQREEFFDEKGDRQPAIRWLLEVMANGGAEHRGASWKYHVFRIEHDEVLNLMNLQRREGLRYSRAELEPKMADLEKRVNIVRAKSAEKRSLYDNKVMELAQRLNLFNELSRLGGPLLLPPQSAGEEWTSLGDFRVQKILAGFSGAVEFAQAKLKADPARAQTITEADESAAFEHLIALAPRVLSEAELKDIRERAASRDPDRFNKDQRRYVLFRLAMADPKKLTDIETRELLFGLRALLTEPEQKELAERMAADLAARTAEKPVAAHWVKMIEAYRAGKNEEFNKLLAEYRDTYLHHVPDEDTSKLGLEVLYNRFQPFYQCVGLYVVVFILCAISWLTWTEPLRKSAFYLLYLTVIIHTVALVVRMYVQGRPPVTNLYSSAVFIGWGCVLLGLLLEKLYPIGIGNILAAVLGLSTTIVSHNLGAGGDTLEMMQAVLDTNFWLATHVTTVTLGYTATFVAGFIGVAYVCRMLAAVVRDSFLTPGTPTTPDLLVFGSAAAGLVAVPVMFVVFILKALFDFEVIPEGVYEIFKFLAIAAGFVYAVVLLFLRASYDGVDAQGNPSASGDLPGPAKVLAKLALDADTGKKMAQMTYGVICFATLLSFVGTVLGGIWADQSWGRFWGWDPKENGAVLIVLWNALILHARWGGLVKARGIAVLAVVGNIITAWSWFGTNQLGIGLHAYGFDNRLAEGCRWFWLSQLVVIGLGLIPQRYWASATQRPNRPAPVVSSGPQLEVRTVAAPAPVLKPAVNGPQNSQQSLPEKGKGGPGKRHGKRR